MLILREGKSFKRYMKERLFIYQIPKGMVNLLELVWLFYNGLTYGEEKLKPLIERYAMLKNLRTELLANCSEVDEGAYAPSAYTKTIPEED